MSFVTGERPPLPSPPIIELMISVSVAPAIALLTGSGTCFAAPVQKLCMAWPSGITTTIGFALPSAIALSMMLFARPIIVQPDSMSPAPWSR